MKTLTKDLPQVISDFNEFMSLPNAKQEQTNVITKNNSIRNIEVLKHLEKTLDALIKKGGDKVAQKYLEGYLEEKGVSSLEDFLQKLA